MVDSWKDGKPGEAVGRGIFEVILLVFGTKGLDKLNKVRSGARGAEASKASPKPNEPSSPRPRRRRTRQSQKSRGSRPKPQAENEAQAAKAAEEAKVVDAARTAAPQGSGPVVRATEDGLLRPAGVDTVGRFEAANPGERLYGYESRTGQADFDYFDAKGRIYDQIGDPRTVPYWGTGTEFLAALEDHLLKLESLPLDRRGTIILDMTSFTDAQKLQVSTYIDNLPPVRRALVNRIGF